MSDNPTPTAAGDCRRAMAMIRHHAASDWPGVKAVLDEALTINRQTQLLIAIIDCYNAIIGLLRTESAQPAMTQAVDLIADQNDNPDWRRAANCIIGRATHDANKFNQAITEGNEADANGNLLLALLDLHGVLLPELCTPIGLAALQKWTTNLAGEEGAA